MQKLIITEFNDMCYKSSTKYDNICNESYQLNGMVERTIMTEIDLLIRKKTKN